MTTDQNIAVVMRSIEEVVNGGNLDAVADIFSADYVGHATGGGADTDRAGVIAQVGQLHQAFRDLSNVVEHVAARDDIVFLHTRLRGTAIDSGRAFDILVLSLDRVADGKIAEAWVMLDEQATQRQLSGAA